MLTLLSSQHGKGFRVLEEARKGGRGFVLPHSSDVTLVLLVISTVALSLFNYVHLFIIMVKELQCSRALRGPRASNPSKTGQWNASEFGTAFS